MDEKITMSIKDFAQAVGIGIQTMYNISRKEGFPLISLGKRKKLVVVEPAKKWLLEHWKEIQ